MSTHVVAFVSPNDPEYQKHLKIAKICWESNVSLPIETEKFFGGDYQVSKKNI